MKIIKIRMFVLFLLTNLIFGVLISISSAEASLEISAAHLDSCSNTSYTLYIDVSFSLESGDTIWYVSTLPDGTHRGSMSSLNYRTSPQQHWGVGYSFSSVPYPYTTIVSYLIRRDHHDIISYGVELTCTGLNQGSLRIIAPAGEAAPDDRVNWKQGDFNVVAYSEPDTSGNMQLIVYCWDDATRQPSLGFTVTQADIDGLTPGPENILLFSAPQCGAYFYYLTSNEFQLNIVTANELYEMIDTDLDFHDAIRRRS